jgi:hypothetical protein
MAVLRVVVLCSLVGEMLAACIIKAMSSSVPKHSHHIRRRLNLKYLCNSSCVRTSVKENPNLYSHSASQGCELRVQSLF